MTTTGVNLSMYGGETKNFAVHTIVIGNQFDLDSATIKWVVQRTMDDESPVLLYKDTASGILITNEQARKFNIRVDPIDTAHIPSGTYFHIAKIIDSSGEHSIAFTGLFTIQRGSRNL